MRKSKFDLEFLPDGEFDDLSIVWSVGLQLAREFSDEWYDGGGPWAALCSDELLDYVEDSMVEYHNTGRSPGVASTVESLRTIVNNRNPSYVEVLEDKLAELDIRVGELNAQRN